MQGLAHASSTCVTGDRRDTARGAGWEFADVAIDHHSLCDFVQLHNDERKETAVQALKAAVAHYRAQGVTVKRLLADNGAPSAPGCLPRPARPWASSTRSPSPTDRRPTARPSASSRLACANGPMVKSGIQCGAHAWLPAFLANYNARRPQSALGYKPPAPRLFGSNLLQLNS